MKPEPLTRWLVVGLSRFELLTPRLSSVCSNQLSYRPEYQRSDRVLSTDLSFRFNHSKNRGPPSLYAPFGAKGPGSLKTRQNVCRTSRWLSIRSISIVRLRPPGPCGLRRASSRRSRKEVIQPQVLLQLPCYDFTPITDHTLSACLPCGLAGRFLVQPAFVM